MLSCVVMYCGVVVKEEICSGEHRPWDQTVNHCTGSWDVGSKQ